MRFEGWRGAEPGVRGNESDGLLWGIQSHSKQRMWDQSADTPLRANKWAVLSVKNVPRYGEESI